MLTKPYISGFSFFNDLLELKEDRASWICGIYLCGGEHIQ